jgi:O-antigen/teichoic acid export membrane protein
VKIRFLVSRLINAAAISVSVIGLALYFGAESWAPVVLLQTISIFLPFLSFGYNEGFGLRLPFRDKLTRKLVPLLLVNTVLSLIVAIALFSFYLFYKLPLFYFILPLALFAILNFSLVRIYLRGIGNIAQLSWLYLVNSTLVFASAYGTYALQDPVFFLLFFHLSQVLSSVIVALWIDLPSGAEIKKSLKGVCGFILAMSKRGFPLMCNFVLFEIFMNADRLHIVLSDNTLALSLVGVALTISRGSYMILSVINTSYYKIMANLLQERNKNMLKRNLIHQISFGLIFSLVVLFIFYTVTNSNFFLERYSSYNGISNHIFWQGLYIVLFSIIVPLSTFCNLYYGGTFYFTNMLMVSAFSASCAIITANFHLGIWVFYSVSCMGLVIVATRLLSKVRRELTKWN